MLFTYLQLPRPLRPPPMPPTLFSTSLLLSEVANGGPTTLLKNTPKTPTHVFSCEIGEIFKCTHFEEYLLTTASLASFS